MKIFPFLHFSYHFHSACFKYSLISPFSNILSWKVPLLTMRANNIQYTSLAGCRVLWEQNSLSSRINRLCSLLPTHSLLLQIKKTVEIIRCVCSNQLRWHFIASKRQTLIKMTNCLVVLNSLASTLTVCKINYIETKT